MVIDTSQVWRDSYERKLVIVVFLEVEEFYL